MKPMSEEPIAKILILAANPQTARKWVQMLDHDAACVWSSPADMPPLARAEVVVSDQDIWAVQGISRDGIGAETGFVRIGSEGPADVCLPADVGPRELRLVCKLLAEIVRLRCQVRFGTELHRHLFRQALTDPLTGLPNRRAWDDALGPRLAEAPRLPGRLCLAVIDLDQFKPINDQHGHAAGDEVLRAAAKALRESLRQDDLLARLGGDEFGLLVQVPDARVAAAVVERARASIGASTARSGFRVSASAGFHLVPMQNAADGNRGVESTPTPEALQAAADAALRRAKQQGRDRTEGDQAD
jgi:diguanylate cyclase (GGDEF)-like protein